MDNRQEAGLTAYLERLVAGIWLCLYCHVFTFMALVLILAIKD